MNNQKIEQNWAWLAERFRLSELQLDALRTYAALLHDWNKKINVTAIDDLPAIIETHFQDSLEIAHFVDFNQVGMIADIGTGGGFPGLPLKIMFPDVKVLLIEVNHKKVQFLTSVIQQLGLQDVQLIDLDWRTFLRQTHFPIDLFVARASLQPIELIRIFKEQSPYKDATLVYWASQHWQSDVKLQPYIAQEMAYNIGNKKRRYIIFKNRAD